MRLAIIALAALVLAGCATTQPVQEPVAAVDTFCLSSRKIRWSTADTAETIRQAEVHNRTIDLRCGVPRKSASR
jgi:hypothetical protein